MFFQNLRKEIQEAIKQLPLDKEFQKRFADDKILDELDEEKFNPTECLKEIRCVLNRKINYKDYKFKNITTKMWSYLWCLENTIVKASKIKKVNETDVDMFFYVLENGIDEDDDVTLVAKSFSYFEKTYPNLNGDDAIEIINMLITNAFAPLKLFPHTKVKLVGDEMPIFDADWLTSMTSKVHAVTGYSPDYIMNSMSMTACCYYYIQYSRLQGVENIEKRTTEEIMIAQDRRASELIVERLLEKGVIKEDERQEILTVMTTPIDEQKEDIQ